MPDASFRAVSAVSDTDVLAVTDTGGFYSLAGPTPTPIGGHPTLSDINAVANVGNGLLVAVGEAGLRLERRQGAWASDEQTLAVQNALLAVAGRSADEVYAAGADGTILVRRLGSWAHDNSGVTSTLRGLAVAGDNVVAVGDDGVWLNKPTPAGPWQRVAVPSGSLALHAVAIRPDVSGRAFETWAVGRNCLILRRVGQGPIERLAVRGTTNDCVGTLHAVSAAGPTTTFAGEQEALFRYSAGQFTSVDSPLPAASIGGLAEANGTLAVAADSSLCFFAGRWSCSERLTNRRLTGVAFDPSAGFLAVGRQGVILVRRP